jgi:hypothetical protein
MIDLLHYELDKYVLNKRFWMGFLAALFAVLAITWYQSRNGAYEEEPVTQTTYDSYRAQVLQEAEQRTQIGIFSKPGTFIYRNAEKIIAAYEGCDAIRITSQTPAGVQLLCEGTICDIVIVAMIFFLMYLIFMEERVNGQYELQRSTLYGRDDLGRIKLLTLQILTIGVVNVICLERLLLVVLLYGPMDLLASIQSIFMESVSHHTVGWMLMCAFLLKVIVCWVLALVLYGTAQFVMNGKTYSWLWMLLLLGSFLLYAFVGENSWLALLKEVNLWNFLHTSALWSRYQNLNIAGWPVYMGYIWAITQVILTLLFLSTLGMYGKHTHVGMSRSRTGWYHPEHVHLALHEGYKLMTIGGWRIVLVALVIGMLATDETYTLYETETQYYNWSYCQELKGTWGQEQEAYLVQEEQRLSKIIETIGQDASAMQLMSGQYMVYNAYMKVCEKAERIRTIPGASFLYESGYERLFVHTNPAGYARQSVLVLVLLLFSMSLVWEMEYRYQILPLLGATQAGISAIRKNKRRLCLLMGACIILLSFLSMYLRVYQTYGKLVWNVPAASLDILKDVPECFSIGAVLLTQDVVLFVGFELIGMGIAGFMKKLMQQGRGAGGHSRRR